MALLGVFKIKQWHIHERIKQTIESLTNEKDLKRVEISITEFENLKWERAGKEFWYNHQLYDVAYSESTTTSIVFYCIDDTEETELYAQLDASLQKQIDNTNDTSCPTAKLLKKEMPLGFPEKLIYAQPCEVSFFLDPSKIPLQRVMLYAQIALNISAPPPR